MKIDYIRLFLLSFSYRKLGQKVKIKSKKNNDFFSQKIAEFAIILELNGYSDCSEIG